MRGDVDLGECRGEPGKQGMERKEEEKMRLIAIRSKCGKSNLNSYTIHSYAANFLRQT